MTNSGLVPEYGNKVTSRVGRREARDTWGGESTDGDDVQLRGIKVKTEFQRTDEHV